MKTFVITGSSRGIGLGLAKRFLEQGHQVMVSGSSQASTDKALSQLTEYGERVAGQPCNVTKHAEVQALWDASVAAFERIDVWINNAGINAVQQPFWEIDVEEASCSCPPSHPLPFPCEKVWPSPDPHLDFVQTKVRLCRARDNVSGPLAFAFSP